MWSLLETFPDMPMIDVIDIGAALNDAPPYQKLVDAGRARIIGFEPDPKECEKLNREFGAPHRFFPNFVGDGRPGTFHETNWSLTGSLYEPNSPLLQKFQNLAEVVTPVAKHAVATTRLDDITEIGNVDLIKIDVQGGELDVFRHGLRALSTTLMIQTEVEFVEFYKGQPMFADVDAFLRANGFQYHTFAGMSGRAFKPLIANGDANAPFRQILWADAVYVRDWMALEALRDVQLVKYAVIAHELLGSYDLAHLVLTELDRRTSSGIATSYLKRLAGE
jgi:protein O-GlcNAc transferase